MSENRRKPVHYVLWVLQVLLALLFIFAGVMKLVTPYEEMAKQMAANGPVFSKAFLLFIGVAELLGGLGLILPSALRIKPGLAPLAAAGLVIIMIGATVTSLKLGPMALIPLVIGLLLAFVAYGRWKLAPIPPRSSNTTPGLHPVSRGEV